MQIVLLPFAGGSSFSYNVLRDHLRHQWRDINLLMLESPGRGRRMREPLLRRFDRIVMDMVDQMDGKLEEGFTLFGHSMGALLAREAAHELKRRSMPMPAHIVCTGSEAPCYLPKGRDYHTRSREELIEVLRGFGGSQSDVLAHPELMQLLEPVFRADFEAVETYRYVERPPLDIPLTVIIGSEEDIAPEEAAAWDRESTLMRPVIKFPGGHFFLFDHAYFFVNHLIISAQTHGTA